MASKAPTPNNGANGIPANGTQGVPAGMWDTFYSNQPLASVDLGDLHRGPGTPRPQDVPPTAPTGWPAAGDLAGGSDG